MRAITYHAKIKSLEKINKQLTEALMQILGWRELRETSAFPIDRIEDIAREAINETKN